MALKIIHVLENYDKETKGSLVLDFITDVLKEKNYKLSEYIRLMLNDWIPIWKAEREYDINAIDMLETELKMFI